MIVKCNCIFEFSFAIVYPLAAGQSIITLRCIKCRTIILLKYKNKKTT